MKENWRKQIRELRLACRELDEDGSQEQHLKRIKEIASSFKTEIDDSRDRTRLVNNR